MSRAPPTHKPAYRSENIRYIIVRKLHAGALHINDARFKRVSPDCRSTTLRSRNVDLIAPTPVVNAAFRPASGSDGSTTMNRGSSPSLAIANLLALASGPAMAQVAPTITGLPAAAALTGAEVLPIYQGS